MATTKKAVYKIYNGTDFDTYHFENEASQVKTSDASDVQTKLNSIDSSITSINSSISTLNTGLSNTYDKTTVDNKLATKTTISIGTTQPSTPSAALKMFVK
jgi:hypothetical protein